MSHGRKSPPPLVRRKSHQIRIPTHHDTDEIKEHDKNTHVTHPLILVNAKNRIEEFETLFHKTYEQHRASAIQELKNQLKEKESTFKTSADFACLLIAPVIQKFKEQFELFKKKFNEYGTLRKRLNQDTYDQNNELYEIISLIEKLIQSLQKKYTVDDHINLIKNIASIAHYPTDLAVDFLKQLSEDQLEGNCLAILFSSIAPVAKVYSSSDIREFAEANESDRLGQWENLSTQNLTYIYDNEIKTSWLLSKLSVSDLQDNRDYFRELFFDLHAHFGKRPIQLASVAESKAPNSANLTAHVRPTDTPFSDLNSAPLKENENTVGSSKSRYTFTATHPTANKKQEDPDLSHTQPRSIKRR